MSDINWKGLAKEAAKEIESLRARLKARDLDLVDSQVQALQWGEHARESQKAARGMESNLEASQRRVRKLEEVITKVLNDEESGTGWGPDVTVCAWLRDALSESSEEAAKS